MKKKKFLLKVFIMKMIINKKKIKEKRRKKSMKLILKLDLNTNKL